MAETIHLLGSLGEFVGAIAVVLTLIYLAIQVRHGSALLEALIKQARQDQLHALIGAIDVDNHASCRLHEKHGFKRVGTLPQVGYKFGHWLDLALYQLLLDTPISPTDG